MIVGYAPFGISVAVLVVKRMSNNLRLLAVSFLGLVLAVGFLTALPLFTGGTIEKLLRDGLRNHQGRAIGTVWIQHFREPSPNPSMDVYRLADRYFLENVEHAIGLPPEAVIRYVATNIYGYWPVNVSKDVERAQSRYRRLEFQSDLNSHITLLDGQPLPVTPVDPEGYVHAVVHTRVAEELSFRVGDRFSFSPFDEYDPTGVQIRVVGIWEEKDPSDPYWIQDPNGIRNSMFINERAMLEVVPERLPQAHREFSWYALIDPDRITSANVGRVLSGMRFLESRMNNILPKAKLFRELPALLKTFDLRAQLLNLLLLALSLPTLAVTLYYIATAIRMIVDHQRSEVALFKSRGASTSQVLGIYWLEGIVMGVLAFVIGPLAGLGLAQVIGQTYGFLLFAQRPALALQITPQVLEYAAAGIVVAILASLVPAAMTANHSIVSYKQVASRSFDRPIWQRFFVDFVLLGIAGYGYYLLTQRQTITFFAKSGELLVEPLLTLAPSVSIVAAALIFLRAFHLIADGLARLATLFAGTSLLMALRQISRAPGHYRPFLLLLIVTIALGTYSASAAQTVGRNFRDQANYRVPAHLIVHELWRYVEATNTWFEPPFSVHYVDGVIDAMPVRKHEIHTEVINGRVHEGTLLAIDRIVFPTIAWWRSDFAQVPLGGLMNALATDQAAILVHPSFVRRFGHQIGDRITLRYENSPIEFFIVETFEYFPPLVPDDEGLIFVANYDYIYDTIGVDLYEVWMKNEPSVTPDQIIERLRENDVNVTGVEDGLLAVSAGRTDPQRTGLLGVLSLGFIIAAALTVVGFFLYSFLSFESRLLQMGVLRSLGLSAPGLLTVIFFEQIFLIVVGVATGTLLGAVAGHIYLPFFHIGHEQQVPPFVIATPWDAMERLYVALALVMLIGAGSTAWLVRRMQLSRAIRLGEQ